MAVKKARLKVVLLDNGTARATATPIDAVGIATTLPSGTSTPVWTSSDPGAVVTPDAADTTGLSAIITPATPPVLVASFTVTCDAVLPDGSTHITGTSDTNSIVAGGPAGFQVATA